MHAKWSSNPNVGFLEIWIDGVNVLPKHMTSNKYSGMRNYLLIGLYRNGRIGDPNLLYPDGSHVYGTDGTPGVAYVDGFVMGRTKESVWPPDPAPAPQTTPAPATTPPVTTGTPAPEPTTAAAPATTAAGIGFPQGSGCSSGGFQSAWLALPLIGLFAMRRRREIAA
jgi:MYXO-CTERM domain-containing protein